MEMSSDKRICDLVSALISSCKFLLRVGKKTNLFKAIFCLEVVEQDGLLSIDSVPLGLPEPDHLGDVGGDTFVFAPSARVCVEVADDLIGSDSVLKRSSYAVVRDVSYRQIG